VDRFPDDSQVHCIILVNHDVAHADHSRPRQIRIGRTPLVRNAARSFTDYFQAANDCVLALDVRSEFRLGFSGDIRECQFGSLKYIE
jgi:hypothetical protein